MAVKNKHKEKGKKDLASSASVKPGFKHTSIGWIPDEWDIKELGKIAKVTSGGTPDRKNKKYWDGNVPWITTSLINFNEINQADEFITEEGLENSSAKLFEPGTLLMALYGQGITRGKTAILKIKASTNQACAAIISDDNEIDKTYLFQYLISKYDQIRQLSNTGNQENLNGEIVKSILIVQPPLLEQRYISNLLTTWDKAINNLQLLIEKKEQRKKWLMQQLLTGKKRLKGFKGKWEEVKISDVAEIDNKSLSNRTLPDYAFQYISLSDVDHADSQVKSEKIIFKDAPSRARRIVSQGDILLATVRPALQGFIIIRDKVKDLIASTGFSVISCTKIYNEFLYQFLFTRAFMKQVEALLVGSNYPAINSSDVKNLKVPFPTIEEQEAISKVLSSLDKELFILKRKIQLFQTQKKGLMQILLTGEKRLVS